MFFESTGARTTEGKVVRSSAVEDQSVHFVQENWQLLHLIHNHPALGWQRQHLCPEQAGIALQSEVLARAQQVDPMSLRQLADQPRRLPRPARPKQEESSGRRPQEAGVGGASHSVNFTVKLTE